MLSGWARELYSLNTFTGLCMITLQLGKIDKHAVNISVWKLLLCSTSYVLLLSIGQLHVVFNTTLCINNTEEHDASFK